MVQRMRTIMTSNFNPWKDIPAAPAGRLSRRRVNADASFALFWFRDDANRPGLLIEISQNISSIYLKNAKINIRDISVDVVEMADEGLRVLLIRLEEEQNSDVFLKLCLDLIERIAGGNEAEDRFHTTCKRLKKWQSLLSGNTKSLLSANEQQGLYAELYFIAEMLQEDSSCETVLIRGWQGPDRIQQDFILGNMAVEIKSVAGNQRGKVRISSEDQLDTHLDRLYLRVYFLSETQEDYNSESLNAVVKRIRSYLTDSENKDLFEIKLETARYIDIAEYGTPFYHVNDLRTYLISEDFPRITRRMLPEGIEAVSYDLVLASIEKFRINVMESIGR